MRNIQDLVKQKKKKYIWSAPKPFLSENKSCHCVLRLLCMCDLWNANKKDLPWLHFYFTYLFIRPRDNIASVMGLLMLMINPLGWSLINWYKSPALLYLKINFWYWIKYCYAPKGTSKSGQIGHINSQVITTIDDIFSSFDERGILE
jgi:hypothetical protein